MFGSESQQDQSLEFGPGSQEQDAKKAYEEQKLKNEEQKAMTPQKISPSTEKEKIKEIVEQLRLGNEGKIEPGVLEELVKKIQEESLRTWECLNYL